MIFTRIFCETLFLLSVAIIVVRGDRSLSKEIIGDHVLLSKRSSERDGTTTQSGSGTDEAHDAALALLNLSSSGTHVPESHSPDINLADGLYTPPQRRRTSTRRKSSKHLNVLPKLDQIKISNKSKVEFKQRVYKQNRHAINQRNRMQRMKDNEPEKYQKYLDDKKKKSAERYKNQLSIQQRNNYPKKSRRKETVTGQTLRNRKWEDCLKINNPEKYNDLKNRRRITSRDCKRKKVRLRREVQGA